MYKRQGKQRAGSGGEEESKGDPSYDTTGEGESGGSYWSLGRTPEIGRGASSKSVMLVRHVPYDFVDCLLLISISGLMLYWFENDEFPRVEIGACREIEDILGTQVYL